MNRDRFEKDLGEKVEKVVWFAVQVLTLGEAWACALCDLTLGFLTLLHPPIKQGPRSSEKYLQGGRLICTLSTTQIPKFCNLNKILPVTSSWN